jgi:nucleoside triphosphate diphosphatase
MTSGRPTAETLPREPMARLLAVMAWLRDRQHGCPWDIDQTFKTIAPYTIEEAYEVADAIERDDLPALKEELGDLLLQVVYHAQIATESQAFNFDDVATAIADKMVDRHPHVFAGARIDTAEAQTVSWEARKAAERAAKQSAEPAGALAGVARALPALLRAEKIQKRAARVGFDWKETAPVIDKIEEELGELRTELEAANLARHCKIDPEAALRATNDKFERRFSYVERRLADQGRKPASATLEEMEMLWQEAKTRV